MFHLDTHPLAKREIDEALDWYGQRTVHKAEEFYERTREILDVICDEPKLFGWYDDDFRLALLGSFPYAVIYRELPGDVVQIIAVAHTSREPGYWKDRVS